MKPEEFKVKFRNLYKEGYSGCNITLPFKEQAFSLSDPFSFTEKVIGASQSLVI